MKGNNLYTKTGGSLLIATLMAASCTLNSPEQHRSLITESGQASIVAAKPMTPATKKKIKIALLLDTSNSMDGLINQAKSQLWKLVNELALATVNGEKPELEIGLYQYGNSGLPSNEGFIQQITAFTGDLDLVSEKLFALSTMGGDEYCGQVIQISCNELNWQTDPEDYKVIFIAGNEEFTQGTVSYKKSCGMAKEKDIFVNTIFCGDFAEGLKTGWKNGASITNGEYMNIDQNKKTFYIETPYDDEISALNDKLNETYIGYGSLGNSKKLNQVKQDSNAEIYGKANKTTRAISKTTSFYSNASWDLVDASKEKTFDITKINDADLPQEMRGKTVTEKQKYIGQKNAEREEIKKQIATLNKKRLEYIAEKEKTMEADPKSLDAAMIKAIHEQAGSKGFAFSEN